MRALRPIALRLVAACGLLAAPVVAQSALHLAGPSNWYLGGLISFELKADADTVVNSLFFDVDYEAFAGILAINNDPTATLPDTISSGGPCNRLGLRDLCVLTYPFSVTIPKDTVVAEWEFLVMEGAPTGSVAFDYNRFFIEADTGRIGNAELVVWPEDKGFEVRTPVPEPSSWLLIVAGLAAMGFCAAHRRTQA